MLRGVSGPTTVDQIVAASGEIFAASGAFCASTAPKAPTAPAATRPTTNTARIKIPPRTVAMTAPGRTPDGSRPPHPKHGAGGPAETTRLATAGSCRLPNLL